MVTPKQHHQLQHRARLPLLLPLLIGGCLSCWASVDGRVLHSSHGRVDTEAATASCTSQKNCYGCASATSGTQQHCQWSSCQGAAPSCIDKSKAGAGCVSVPCGKPLPPAPAPCSQHHFLSDTNIVGNDIKNVHTGLDPATCCATCKNTPGCKGWTLLLHFHNGRCYLKSASSPIQRLDGAVSGSGNAPSPPANWTLGCGSAPQNALPFCNPLLPRATRLADLMGRLYTPEKLAMLRTLNPAIPRLGIGSYDWDTEVLHGVFSNRNNFPADVATPSPTIFPQGIALAATFDTALVQQIGDAIAVEQRALNNRVRARAKAPLESGQYQGVNGYAPNCNLYRDPRWGRAQETYGESPVHNGAICAAFIRGLQGNHSEFMQIAATVKHFAFYSGPECDHGCSEFPGINRLDFNAIVDKQDAAQSYLPMFASAVGPIADGGGGSAGVMNSFSHVNGVAMPANKKYMDMLREDFGFGNGLIVTDWGSIARYEKGDKQALPESLKLGFISEADIDRALNRSLSLSFQLGRFEPPGVVPFHKIPFSAIGSAAHRELAQRAAIESLVMLRNKPATGHTIPLLPLESSKVRGIAVVGPNSVAQDACTPFGGDYCICQRCATNHTIGIFEGLRNYLQLKNSRAVVSTSPGCTLSGNDTSEFAAAEALMRSDHISHVVVAVGLSGQLEGEGSDRVPSHLPKGILLPGRQQELLDLAASIGKPLILVVVAGGATPVSPSVNITAEFAALYPGLETGNAFASILFGESSPAGRLPFSIPATVSQLGDYLNFSMSTKPFGRTFSWMQGSGSQQLHEYGFGLSYGKWAYSKLAISPARLPTTSITAATDAAPPISVVVTVYNHGQHTSDEVVQVYSNWTVHDPSQMRVPVRQLVAFSRLRDVKPGETRTVTIYVRSKHYALVDSRGERVLPEGELTVSVGGSQPTSYSYRAGATHAVSQTLVVMATGT